LTLNFYFSRITGLAQKHASKFKQDAEVAAAKETSQRPKPTADVPPPKVKIHIFIPQLLQIPKPQPATVELVDDEPPAAAAPKAAEPTTEKAAESKDGIVLALHSPHQHSVPVGNGGTTDKYSWTQSLKDVTVVIPVPKQTKYRSPLIASLLQLSSGLRMCKSASSNTTSSPHSTAT
jgi:hypothetical protein